MEPTLKLRPIIIVFLQKWWVTALRSLLFLLQIGDNDSGRFLKLQPVYKQLSLSEAVSVYDNLRSIMPSEEIYLDEDHLDHRHLVSRLLLVIKREHVHD